MFFQKRCFRIRDLDASLAINKELVIEFNFQRLVRNNNVLNYGGVWTVWYNFQRKMVSLGN